MALGLLGSASGRTLQIRLAENVGGDGLDAPALVTDGFNLLSGPAIFKRFIFDDKGALMISCADGAAISIASVRAYGYYGEHVSAAGPAGWGPMGPGSAAARGLMNLGGVVAQVGTSKIILLEDIDGLLTVERIAFALGEVTGTGTPLVNVDLILKRRVH